MEQFLLLPEVVKIRERVEELVMKTSESIAKAHSQPKPERRAHVEKYDADLKSDGVQQEYQELFLKFCEIAFEHFRANSDPTGIASAYRKWGEMVRLAKHKGRQRAGKKKNTK